MTINERMDLISHINENKEHIKNSIKQAIFYDDEDWICLLDGFNHGLDFAKDIILSYYYRNRKC